MLSKLFNERLHKESLKYSNDYVFYVLSRIQLLGKTAQTQIILPPETTLTLYHYIYLENNTTYGAKYR